MPNKESHLSVARDNELLIQQMNRDNPAARGWAATIAFYAALHYVEAYLSTLNRHSADHRTRDTNLCNNPATKAIYFEFCELKNISTSARYFGKYPTKTDLDVDIAPNLATIKSELSKHF